METEYSFEHKEKIAKQIQRLKKRQHFIDIQNIIINHNPEINITTNHSGHFMYFQNLKTDTYIAIEKYIKKININRILSENSDNVDKNTLNNEKNIDDIKKYSHENDQFFDNPRLKYSNKEKNLIKRKNYDEEVNNQGETHVIIIENPNLENKKIFVKRKSIKDKLKTNINEEDTTITLS
jgi:hypothetical protein